MLLLAPVFSTVFETSNNNSRPPSFTSAIKADDNPDVSPRGMVTYYNGTHEIYGELHYSGETVAVLFDNIPAGPHSSVGDSTKTIFLGWSTDPNATTPDYYTFINNGNRDQILDVDNHRSFVMGIGDVDLYAVWQAPASGYDISQTTVSNITLNVSTTSYARVTGTVGKITITGSSSNTFYLLLDNAVISGAPAIDIQTATTVKIQYSGSSKLSVGATTGSVDTTINNSAIIKTNNNGALIVEGRNGSILDVERSLPNGSIMNGALIGGSSSSSSGTIQIESGTLNAKTITPTNQSSPGVSIAAAGIGGGARGTGKVIINGGNVNVALNSNAATNSGAHLGMLGAGIGGGAGGEVNTSSVTINGGAVYVSLTTLNSTVLGAGIGAGGGSDGSSSSDNYSGNSATVTITGGRTDVRLYAAGTTTFKAAAIGGGGGYKPGNADKVIGGDADIYISGGTTTTYRSHSTGGSPDIGPGLNNVGSSKLVVDGGSISVSSYGLTAGGTNLPNSLQTTVKDSAGRDMARYVLSVNQYMKSTVDGVEIQEKIKNVMLSVNDGEYTDLGTRYLHSSTNKYLTSDTYKADTIDDKLYIYIPIHQSNDVSIEYGSEGKVLFYEDLVGLRFDAQSIGNLNNLINHPNMGSDNKPLVYRRVRFYLTGITYPSTTLAHVLDGETFTVTLTADQPTDGSGVRYVPPQIYAEINDIGAVHTWARTGQTGVISVPNVNGELVIVASAISGYNVKYVYDPVAGIDKDSSQLTTWVNIGQNVTFTPVTNPKYVITDVKWTTALEVSGTLNSSTGTYTLNATQFASDVTITITTKATYDVDYIFENPSLDEDVATDDGSTTGVRYIYTDADEITFEVFLKSWFGTFSISWRYVSDTYPVVESDNQDPTKGWVMTYSAAGKDPEGNYIDYERFLEQNIEDQDPENQIYYGSFQDGEPTSFTISAPDDGFAGDIEIRIEIVRVWQSWVTAGDGSNATVGKAYDPESDSNVIIGADGLYIVHGVAPALYVNDTYEGEGAILNVYVIEYEDGEMAGMYDWDQWCLKIEGSTRPLPDPGEGTLLPKFAVKESYVIQIITEPVYFVIYEDKGGDVIYLPGPDSIPKGSTSLEFNMVAADGWEINTVSWRVEKNGVPMPGVGGSNIQPIESWGQGSDDYMDGSYKINISGINYVEIDDNGDIYIIYVSIETITHYTVKVNGTDKATFVGDQNILQGEITGATYNFTVTPLSNYSIYNLTWFDGTSTRNLSEWEVSPGVYNVPWSWFNNTDRGTIVITIEADVIYYISVKVYETTANGDVLLTSAQYSSIMDLSSIPSYVIVGEGIIFSAIPDGSGYGIYKASYAYTLSSGGNWISTTLQVPNGYISDRQVSIRGDSEFTFYLKAIYNVDYGNKDSNGNILDIGADFASWNPTSIYFDQDLIFEVDSNSGYVLKNVGWTSGTDTTVRYLSPDAEDRYTISKADTKGDIKIIVTIVARITFNLTNVDLTDITDPSETYKTIEVPFGGTFTIPSSYEPESSRDYYSFVNWNENAYGLGTGYALETAYKETGNKVLYASWQGWDVTLVFQTGTGAPDITKIGAVGEYETIPGIDQVGTNDPLSFMGWKIVGDNGTVYVLYKDGYDIEHTDVTINNLLGPETDGRVVVFEAVWGPQLIYIYLNDSLDGQISLYDDDGGVSTDADNIITLWNKGGWTNSNYTLVGWLKGNTGKILAVDASFSLSDEDIIEDTIFYAVWKYVISFDLDGGNGTFDDIYADNDENINLPLDEPTKSGYIFDGWSDGTLTYQPGEPYTVTGDVEFTAIWTPAPFTVRWNVVEGANITASDGQTNLDNGDDVTYGDTVTFRVSYETGFYFVSANGTKISDFEFTARIIGNFTFALVVSDLYAVTWDAPTGSTVTVTATDDNNEFTDLIDGKAHYGHTVRFVVELENEYYITYVAIGNVVQDDSMVYTAVMGVVPMHLTLTVSNLYTLTYNANYDGAPSVKTELRVYGSTSALTGNTFTRTGYTFAGWNTAADGSGDDYNDLDPYTMGPSATLYAQWTANTYTIEYNENGGNGSVPDDADYTYGSGGYNVEETPKPTMVGYTFGGWSTTPTGTTPRTSLSDSDFDALPNGGTLTLYAIWIQDVGNATVTVKKDGSVWTAASAEITLKSGSTLISTLSGTAGVYTTTSAVPVGTYDIYADGVNTGQTVAITKNGNGTADVDYFTLTLVAGTGIDSVTSSSVDSGTGIGVVLSGSSVTINANVTTNYTWSQWTADPSSFTGADSQNPTFYMPAYALSLTATTVPKYDVTFNGNGNTGGSVNTITQDYGTEVTVPGYGFTKIGYTQTSWNTASDGNGTTYTAGQKFNMPAGGLELYAIWKIIEYNVHVDEVHLTSDAPATVDWHAELKIQLTANPGYDLPSTVIIKMNAADVPFTYVNGQITISAGIIEGDIIIIAGGNAITYAVTYDANGGRGVPSNDSYTYGTGGYTVDTMTEPILDGYYFRGWSLVMNGSAVYMVTDSDFITYQNNGTLTLYAVWEAVRAVFEITVQQPSEGGSISPEGIATGNEGESTVAVSEGDDVTFTFTADKGYKIKDLVIDGISYGAISSYTFTDIDSDHTVTMVVEKSEHSLWMPMGMLIILIVVIIAAWRFSEISTRKK